MSLTAMNIAILIGALLVAVAIFTSVLSFRFGAPLLLAFLLIGLGAGEDGLGIQFDDAPAAYFIGTIALALILFDSGFNTHRSTIRTAIGPAAILATIGVVLTTLLVGGVARLIFGFDWLEAFLLGAILSSTDAAAVFFLLRAGGISLRERLRATLEIESSSNDPMAVFLTIGLIELIVSGAGFEGGALTLLTDFVLQIGLGGAIGLVGGYLIRFVIDRVGLDGGLYPIIFLALALIVFAAASLLGGSGFLAVYLAGVLAGNSRMRHAPGLRRFSQALTWLSQIAMFLALGLLATPSEFPGLMLQAVGLAAFLILVARPLVVFACVSYFRFTVRELVFLGWVGLRGSVSILLGILPVIADLPEGRTLFNVAFIVVLASLLVQGWSIGPLARRLGLTVPPRLGPLQRTDLELPGGGDHEVVAYRVHPESPVVQGSRIPRWARPSLVIRKGVSLRPQAAGPILADDHVYIVAASAHVHLLDHLFAGPAGDLEDAGLYGEFTLGASVTIGALAETYGLSIPEEEASTTLGAFLQDRLHGDIEMGDRVGFGPIDLIVRAVGENHEILEVGLGIDPEGQRRVRRWSTSRSARWVVDWQRNLLAKLEGRDGDSRKERSKDS